MIGLLWVDVGLLGGSSCSFVFAWVHSGGHSGLRVDYSSRGLPPARLGDVGFILVRVGSLRRL